MIEAALLVAWTSLIARLFYLAGQHHGLRDAAKRIAAEHTEMERWEIL